MFSPYVSAAPAVINIALHWPAGASDRPYDPSQRVLVPDEAFNSMVTGSRKEWGRTAKLARVFGFDDDTDNVPQQLQAATLLPNFRERRVYVPSPGRKRVGKRVAKKLVPAATGTALPDGAAA